MAVCSTTSCMLQEINVPSTAVCSPLKMTRCPEDATVNGGYFTAKRTGLVKIDASKDSVYAPVAVATNGTVTEWSADAYDTLYVVSGKPVTLRPTYKLKSVVSGGEELNYNDGNGAVSFTVGAEAVQLNSVIWKVAGH